MSEDTVEFFKIVIDLIGATTALNIKTHEEHYHNGPKPVDAYAECERIKAKVSEWAKSK